MSLDAAPAQQAGADFGVFQGVVKGRHQGNEDDAYEDWFDILFDPRYAAADVVAEQGNAGCPGDIAYGVVYHELFVVHLAGASRDGGETADDGDEVGDQHGLGAVFLIELLGFHDEVFAKDEAVFFFEQAWPKVSAYMVSGIITGYGGDGDDDYSPENGQYAGRS